MTAILKIEDIHEILNKKKEDIELEIKIDIEIEG